MNNSENGGNWQLYWRADTGAYAPEVVLELCEVNWQRINVDPKDIKTESKDVHETFLKLSPLQQVPLLVLPDGTIMTESVAMVMYLADCHPHCDLMPAVGDPARAHACRWLVYLATNVYDACLRHYYSERYTTNSDHADSVKARAREHLDRYWGIVESELARSANARPRSPSLLDIYIHMLQSWHPDNPQLLRNCPSVARVSAQTHANPDIARIDQLHPLLLKSLGENG